MCGIAGKLIFHNRSFNRKTEIKNVKNALVHMHHRGPDDDGYFLDVKNRIWLALTRLSIIDLTLRAHQPMVSSDGRFVLVFNGEIYNYKQLRKLYTPNYPYRSDTDTEVLLVLFQLFAEKCLTYLRGMFAFVIWDNFKKKLFVARDRLGKKPVRYILTDNYFAFASELPVLSDISTGLRRPDFQAIGDFLTLGFVPSPASGISGMYKLPPSHYMTISSQAKVTIKRYWDVDYSNKWYISSKEWGDRLTESITEAVKLRLQSDVPVAAHLSGGIDSSIVCAFASSLHYKPINTLSVGYKKSASDELKQARLVSDYLGTNHHEVVVSPNDLPALSTIINHTGELLSDPSVLPTWFLCKETKRIASVALNGDGGDEVFAGYYRYLLLQAFTLIKLVPFKKFLGSLSQNLHGNFPDRLLFYLGRILSLPYYSRDAFYLELLRFATTVKSREMVTPQIRQILDSQTEKQTAKLSQYTQNGNNMDGYTHFDLEVYLPDDLLTKADLISMAHSVEARSPLLDHQLIELTSHMPASVRFGLMQNKPMLRKIAKRYLPSCLLNFGKTPFVPPLAEWFRSDSRFLKHELLNSDDKLTEFVNLSHVKRIISEHENDLFNHAYTLWTLLTLKYWLKRWF